MWAIDSSRAMGEYLRVKAASAGLDNVETVHASAVSIPLVDNIADLVVSNYCLHEMRDADKDRALAEAARILKPGGRIVIGDMMFSLNPLRSRDRRVVAVKLVKIARRGLPGVWRLLKNAIRLIVGRWEYPAHELWWREALLRSGFDQVRIQVLAHEGGIAFAERTPGPSAGIKCSNLASPPLARVGEERHGSASSDATPGSLPSEAMSARAPA